MQDWLYEDGEDTTKSIYVAKMDDIRFIVGPIVQRYREKAEAEAAAIQKVKDEEAAKKRAEQDAKRQAEEEAKKAAEAANKSDDKTDSEMKDASEGQAEEKQ